MLTRAQSSSSFISCPSPKLPDGDPGGTKYAMKRAWLRTHSLFARSMSAALRNTYHAMRLLPVSQKPCGVPLAKPPSRHPHGLVHAIAAGSASFTQRSASAMSPAVSAPMAATMLSVRLPWESYG